MQITLKKAAAIGRELQNQLAAITLQNSVKVSVYDKVGTGEQKIWPLFEKSAAALQVNIDLAYKIEDIIYKLRQLRGDANAAWGINDLMTQREKLQARESRIKAQIRMLDPDANYALTSAEGIEARLETMRERLASGAELRHITTEFNVAIPVQEIITALESQSSDIKREKIRLKDRLDELNASKTIELNPQIVEDLRSLGIID